VQAGAAPIEGAAVLAAEARERLGALAPALRERAERALEAPGISVVEAALCAARCGASALHDPTEGGLATGLQELARASGLRLRLDEQAVLWFEPGLALCRALGADPWGVLASGTLLAAFAPERAAAALEALADRGARVIATAEEGSGVVRSDGRPLTTFARDEVARVLEAQRHSGPASEAHRAKAGSGRAPRASGAGTHRGGRTGGSASGPPARRRGR
jgi:hydrogenase maturation factor